MRVKRGHLVIYSFRLKYTSTLTEQVLQQCWRETLDVRAQPRTALPTSRPPASGCVLPVSFLFIHTPPAALRSFTKQAAHKFLLCCLTHNGVFDLDLGLLVYTSVLNNT